MTIAKPIWFIWLVIHIHTMLGHLAILEPWFVNDILSLFDETLDSEPEGKGSRCRGSIINLYVKYAISGIVNNSLALCNKMIFPFR